jgi:hypothetical protein
MFDRYTKAVLTVIAVSLTVIAAQGVVRPAQAQMEGCGINSMDACYVRTDRALPVMVERFP